MDLHTVDPTELPVGALWLRAHPYDDDGVAGPDEDYEVSSLAHAWQICVGHELRGTVHEVTDDDASRRVATVDHNGWVAR